MIVPESEVEIKKFKMFAEKADSEQKIIELCKKYLKHKGIDVDEAFDKMAVMQSVPAQVQKIYVGQGDLKHVHARMMIDEMVHPTLSKIEMGVLLRKELAQRITYELMKGEHIKFEEQYDPSFGSMYLHAALKVYDDRRTK